MGLVRRAAVTAALVGALLPWAVAPASGTPSAPSGPSLPQLTAQLAAVTAHLTALQGSLDQAAAQDGWLRVAFDRADAAHAQAQWALDARARQVYMAATDAPVGSWIDAVADPDLQRLMHQGESAALRVDESLVSAVSARSAQLASLQRLADAYRRRLMPAVQQLLAEQDHARSLLAQAQALADAAQAAQLAEQRAILDNVSAATALVMTVGQVERARAALAVQEPVVNLLEVTGSAYPAGYAPTGELLSGTASWYGPGFVGSPTASGAPYDPERLTCANKTLPLGTVIRVSANGRAVSCLVNDRGPYVGDRVLDMSWAGAQALGYTGLAQVTIEVLAPA